MLDQHFKLFKLLDIGSIQIALDILLMYCYQDSEKWNACESVFKELVTTLKLEKKGKKQSEMYHWKDVVERLLQDNDLSFAIKVTNQIIKSCSDKLNYSDLWHYIQPIIRLLFKKYAKEVWPLFSEAILNAPPSDGYKYARLLDSGNAFDKKKPSVLSDLPDEILKDWCLQNPEIAPEFVAEATDVLLEDGEKHKISPRAMFLIDNFGDNKNVLSALSSNMSSFGWSGSMVPYLQKEIEALMTLKNHNNNNVRAWIINYEEKHKADSECLFYNLYNSFISLKGIHL